ncbi:hypothetical protein QR680_014175 [Steinernema hermaphroditum]|uniref:Peptidase C1A papain C-terminal domain-containing protein n=1 Tax=Steinernema hermaphroditum TaxID=289476 RepID=A0AA39M2R4_9BILA|nr:hypothetical protein QR680_014175 [Steinernema hermaphroditum]
MVTAEFRRLQQKPTAGHVMVPNELVSEKGAVPPGHAVAPISLIGDHLLLRNSWSNSWGYRCYAIIPYPQGVNSVWGMKLGGYRVVFSKYDLRTTDGLTSEDSKPGPSGVKQ